MLLAGALAGCADCGGGGDGSGGGAGGAGGRGGGAGGGGGRSFSLDVAVTAVSPATGAVRWRAGGLAGGPCAGSCRYPVPEGTSVLLTAEPSAGAAVQAWSGDCADAGFATTCAVVMSADRAAAVALTPYNRIFVSSVLVAPRDLGGLDGADALCRALAADAGLPGTYVAGLSTAGVPLASRLPPAARGWFRADGRPFADSPARLFGDGQALYPPRFDERGRDLYTFDFDVPVVTGTDARGQPGVEQCAGYTGGGPAEVVTLGLAAAGAGSWVDAATGPCSQPAHLYCLGVSFAAPVALARDPANRAAFLSREAFVPDGGLAAADAQCQADARDAGLPGTFAALLASGATATPGSRFSTAGPPWQLPSGLLLARTAADFFSPTGFNDWLSGVTAFADGRFAAGRVAYWTGASSPIGLPVSTCGDWTSAASGDFGLYMDDVSLSGGFYLRPKSTPCSLATAHLVCLQQ